MRAPFPTPHLAYAPPRLYHRHPPLGSTPAAASSYATPHSTITGSSSPICATRSKFALSIGSEFHSENCIRLRQTAATVLPHLPSLRLLNNTAATATRPKCDWLEASAAIVITAIALSYAIPLSYQSFPSLKKFRGAG